MYVFRISAPAFLLCRPPLHRAEQALSCSAYIADGWMDGWMDGCLSVCMDVCLYGWMDLPMHERKLLRLDLPPKAEREPKLSKKQDTAQGDRRFAASQLRRRCADQRWEWW